MVVCPHLRDKLTSQQLCPWYGRFYPIQAIFINIQLLNVIHLHEFVSLFTILTRRKSKYAQQANKYTTLCYLHIGCIVRKFGPRHMKEFKFNRSCFDNVY